MNILHKISLQYANQEIDFDTFRAQRRGILEQVISGKLPREFILHDVAEKPFDEVTQKIQQNAYIVEKTRVKKGLWVIVGVAATIAIVISIAILFLMTNKPTIF